MRVSTMIRVGPPAEQNGGDPDNRLIDRITEFGRQVEARGFPGIWIGDSLGRGRPTLDSLQVLTALAAVTRQVELGISVLQLPLRNPVELAHRVQSLQAMSNNRLVLGVGRLFGDLVFRLEERLGRRPARSHDLLSLISREDSGRLRLRKDFLRTFYPFAISKRHSLILASEFRSIPPALLPDAPEGLCPPQC